MHDYVSTQTKPKRSFLRAAGFTTLEGCTEAKAFFNRATLTFRYGWMSFTQYDLPLRAS